MKSIGRGVAVVGIACGLLLGIGKAATACCGGCGMMAWRGRPAQGEVGGPWARGPMCPMMGGGWTSQRMEARWRLMTTAVIAKDDPASLLDRGARLKLTDKQVEKLEAVLTSSREDAKKVLTAEQKKKLEELSSLLGAPAQEAGKGVGPGPWQGCWWMAQARLPAADTPGAILAFRADLELTDAQVRKMEGIIKSSRAKARKVLTDEQGKTFEELSPAPWSSMEEWRGVMCPMHARMFRDIPDNPQSAEEPAGETKKN